VYSSFAFVSAAFASSIPSAIRSANSLADSKVERGCWCQGTPAAVPTQVDIRASALNKGGSGDPGARSAVSRTARGQAVSGIYTRNHSRYYLLIVTLLA
jgi:hypothetical protein